MHMAAQNGHSEVVQLLCGQGTDKDKAMQDGGTPMYRASQEGPSEVVRLSERVLSWAMCV